jgi:hypothetical protein
MQAPAFDFARNLNKPLRIQQRQSLIFLAID